MAKKKKSKPKLDNKVVMVIAVIALAMMMSKGGGCQKLGNGGTGTTTSTSFSTTTTLIPDNDGDGIPDSTDSDDDNDGFSDDEEQQHGTDPFDPGDYPGSPTGDYSDYTCGVNGDIWCEGTCPSTHQYCEAVYFGGYDTCACIDQMTNSVHPAWKPGGSMHNPDLMKDSDGDGYTDWEENEAGTDPNDEYDYPGAPDCRDSDGGINPNVFGSATVGGATQYDNCDNNDRWFVYEIYCDGDSYAAQRVDCRGYAGGICHDGYCRTETCIDSDGGQISTVYGWCIDATNYMTDSCYVGWISEKYCSAGSCTWTSIDCANECVSSGGAHCT